MGKSRGERAFVQGLLLIYRYKFTSNPKMRKSILTIIGFCFTFSSFAQTTNYQELIKLGKSYNDFIFRNEPTREDIKEIELGVPDSLKIASDFIVQTCTKNSRLLTPQFLARPTDQVLKQIYVLRAINLNHRETNPIDNQKLIDSLMVKEIPAYELVENYYNMLFSAVGNKNQPFNLSKVDIKIGELNLKDDTEKGILFLDCMHLCGVTIWGYMNIVKPPNTKKAYENIKKFPKINGRPYFQFAGFYFDDFEMIIDKDKGPQSYKSYFLNKYYETLLSHLICLNKEGGSEKEKNDLLLGSILKDRNLYQYTKYKETLEGIFQTVKQE